jgi:sugar fermentation stimulation protein A
MKFETELIPATFIKRYKRFFADIEINGEIVTAHVPNTGSMKSCIEENADCYVTKNNDPKRKLKYTLQLIKAGNSWAGVNTGLTNKLVQELFLFNKLDHWKNFDCIQSEVKINEKSRLDFALWNKVRFNEKKIKPNHIQQNQFHFIEVKNVTLKMDDRALFPDSVTTRGQKHIEELIHLKQIGHSTELMFVVQREFCQSFCPAKDIDPVYSNWLLKAKNAGVLITAIQAKFKNNEISLINGNLLPVVL